MDVFKLRNRLIDDYRKYSTSFLRIGDDRIEKFVTSNLDAGALWPDPLIQLNPAFERGATIDELCDREVLHDECRRVFRVGKEENSEGRPMTLYRHQAEAVEVARTGDSYVLTTGTGSGKSLAYIVPIVDRVLRTGSGKGIQAIVVYPMNALANSQLGELTKFVRHGYPDGNGPVTFARYTGQDSDEDKQAIIANPPDILLTNYVMLELILTRPHERNLIEAARNLKFLVLDELHTYRGRQGADVAFLVRRTRNLLDAEGMQCVGTSATLAGPGSLDQQRAEVANVATRLFGVTVKPEAVIGETLRRATPARDPADAQFQAELREALEGGRPQLPGDYELFRTHPLASWIETTFGLREEEGSGRLVRTEPRSITGETGVATELAELTGADEETCITAIQATLLAGYGAQHPDTDFPAFACQTRSSRYPPLRERPSCTALRPASTTG